MADDLKGAAFWLRRHRIRRITRAIEREKALVAKAERRADVHRVRVKAWRMVLRDVLYGRR